MNIDKGIGNKEEMAIYGWKIWNNIIMDISAMEDVAYFVVIMEKDFSVSMINDLITCYVNVRKINSICVITTFYDETNLLYMEKNVKRILLSEYEIDCLLTYYSICKFTKFFYVFSFCKMGRRIPKELYNELSKFEIAAAGILKIKKSELEAWYGLQNRKRD